MDKAILIYNPKSGDQSINQKLDYVIKRFQQKNILLQPYRIFSNDEEEISSILSAEKYSFVIVSGGDGTLNYVANIILKNNLNIPIGILPTGTSNDFARCLSLPVSFSDCLDIILNGNIVEVDAGLINENQYFLSTCAGGVFVDVSFSTHNELKKNFGPFAYYLKALSELTSIKSFKVAVKTENGVVDEEILLFLILNGQHAAGFYNLIEEADVSDGIMDIVLIKSCSHIDLASLFFKVLSNDYLNNRNVIKIKAKSCIIESNKNINLSVDGEKGDELPINVRFINKALKVFCR